jgi:hypothetical protein
MKITKYINTIYHNTFVKVIYRQALTTPSWDIFFEVIHSIEH